MNMLPPAIALFSALLKERGHEVDLFDATYYQTDHGVDSDGTKADRLNVVPFSQDEKGIKMRETDWRSDIQAKIQSFEPNLIALSTTEDMWLLGVRILEEIEEYINRHKIPVIAGGVFPTFAPELVINHRLIDMVCIGEGENSMIDLCQHIEKGEEYGNVTNLWIKQKDGSISKNPISNPFDINETPIIDIGLFEEQRLYRPMAGKWYKMMPVETIRGCPYKCNFCDIPHKNYNFRTAANVADEIEEILSLGINEINIMDDTFNLRRQRIVDICNEIIDRKLKFQWVGRGRVYPFDEELAMLLKKSGCYRFHIGIESGSKEILDDIGKKISLKQIRNFFKFCRTAKIDVLAYFILGFPDETEEQIRESIDFSKEIGCKYAYFSILSLFPGTPVYELGKTRNVVQGDPWLEFAKNPVKDFKIPFWTETISRDRLFEVLREAYTQFYFSPKYLGQRVIEVLRSPKHTGGMVKAGMAMAKYVVSNKKGF